LAAFGEGATLQAASFARLAPSPMAANPRPDIKLCDPKMMFHDILSILAASDYPLKVKTCFFLEGYAVSLT